MDNAQKQIKRLKKLYNMLQDLNFFRQLVVEEKCNLPHKMDPYKKYDDEDDQEILSIYLMPYIKPGNLHLDLIEFLFQKMAKETFENCIFYDDETSEFRVKRIRIMASRFGLLSQSKFSKNLNFNKVIEGKSGVEPSVKLTYELAKLVKARLKTKRIEREQSHRLLFLECTYTMIILSLIKQIKSSLINLDLNPFSIDFPLENELLYYDDLKFHINKLEDEVNKDNYYLQEIHENNSLADYITQQNQDEESLLEIQISQLEKDVDDSYELSKEDLASYKNQLDFFKDSIIRTFDIGRKETYKLQKKIEQQEFDKEDEKNIEVGSKFLKIYRRLQQMKEQILTCNLRYNISDRLEDLVKRMTLLQTQNLHQKQQEFY